MDNPQPHTPASAQSDDQSDDMLPAVQSPAAQQGTGFDDPTQIVPQGQTMPNSHALVPMPEEASDSDLIEKEWVLKAKQIVEHTSENPFQQAEELAKMRTEYLKKRYNKDIGQA